MIIITGGAGFIGSQLIKNLNESGYDDIVVVDDLTDGDKIHNLSDKNISDYIDKDDFIVNVKSGYLSKNKIDNIFHLGACSSTTERDGKFLMNNNYEYSKVLLEQALVNEISFIYASSASVYGLGSEGFYEKRTSEIPINAYAYSKFLFDQIARKAIIANSSKSQIAGLRYFNVFGPGENHKDRMSSVVYHFFQQVMNSKSIALFAGQNGVDDGEQKRDFIHVDDCVTFNRWLMENSQVSGIFNCGTGVASTFNDVANIIKNWAESKLNEKVIINYINFPQDLVGKYQDYTCADMSRARKVGYKHETKNLEDGIISYLNYLNENH